MKKVLGLILSAVFLVGQAGFASAATFGVSASIPLASTASTTVSSVNAVTNAFTTVSTTSLGFGALSFNTTNAINIWLPNVYYALDIAPTGGAGTPDVTFKYTEGTNPNSSVGKNGLGWKTTATFVSIANAIDPKDGLLKPKETPIGSHGPKKMLKDLTGEHILASEVGAGGYLRVYLGIVTGDPNAAILDPAGAEVFSNADRPGAYDGELTITSTIV